MPNVSRTTIAGSNRASELKITKNGKKSYDYYFTDCEFITDKNKIVINFTLPDIGLAGGERMPAQISIVDYCTTKAGAVISVDPTNASVTRSTPYPRGNREVAFEVNLDPHEMLFIGLIIEVEEDGKYIHFICDPQVGNGPPSDDLLGPISQLDPDVLANLDKALREKLKFRSAVPIF